MKHLLVIEDNRHLGIGLRNNLEIEGYRVELTSRWREWVAAGPRHPPDLIILDLMLPRLDGYVVLRTLREEGCETPVLILSARGEEADKVRGFRLGADDYVAKPFGLLSCWRASRCCCGAPEARTAAALRIWRHSGSVRCAWSHPRIACGARMRAVAPPEGVRPADRARPPGRCRGHARRAAPQCLGLCERSGSRTVDTHVAELRSKARGRSGGTATHPHGAEDGIPAANLGRGGRSPHPVWARRIGVTPRTCCAGPTSAVR